MFVKFVFSQKMKIAPPTPIPTNAVRNANAMKLVAPPAATPNAPPINKVILNAYLK